MMAFEALEQAHAECLKGRIPKTRALAFTLAYLWQNGGGDRRRYDEFWMAATGPPEDYHGWSRSTQITSCLNGIYYAHGMWRTVDIAIEFDRLYNPVKNDGMCNHYRNDPAKIPTWREYIGAADGPDLSGVKDNVWPKYQGIVARIDSGQKVLDAMQWGVPLEMKGKREGSTITKRITNVRNLQSNFWRSMLTRPENRCLVPFNEFAEPKPNAGREEVWFNVSEEPVSAFAGIWRETDEGNAYAFLTCEPNPLVKPIHPKAMPVILQPDDYGRWLAGDDAEEFQAPFPSQLMSIVQ